MEKNTGILYQLVPYLPVPPKKRKTIKVEKVDPETLETVEPKLEMEEQQLDSWDGEASVKTEVKEEVLGPVVDEDFRSYMERIEEEARRMPWPEESANTEEEEAVNTEVKEEVLDQVVNQDFNGLMKMEPAEMDKETEDKIIMQQVKKEEIKKKKEELGKEISLIEKQIKDIKKKSRKEKVFLSKRKHDAKIALMNKKHEEEMVGITKQWQYWRLKLELLKQAVKQNNEENNKM